MLNVTMSMKPRDMVERKAVEFEGENPTTLRVDKRVAVCTSQTIFIRLFPSRALAMP